MAKNEELRKDVNRILGWAYAAPVLGFWALISFVPFFGLLMEGVSIPFVLAQLGFAATGFVSVAAIFALYKFAKVSNPRDEKSQRKSAVLPLTLYATVWLVAFGLFVYFTEPPMVDPF